MQQQLYVVHRFQNHPRVSPAGALPGLNHLLQEEHLRIGQVGPYTALDTLMLTRVVHIPSSLRLQRLVALHVGKTSNVSQAINMAIKNPALWAIMKLGARNAMMSTAEKAGIPWRNATRELMKNAEVSIPDRLQLCYLHLLIFALLRQAITPLVSKPACQAKLKS